MFMRFRTSILRTKVQRSSVHEHADEKPVPRVRIKFDESWGLPLYLERIHPVILTPQNLW